jgi:hypothetical protein
LKIPVLSIAANGLFSLFESNELQNAIDKQCLEQQDHGIKISRKSKKYSAICLLYGKGRVEVGL